MCYNDQVIVWSYYGKNIRVRGERVEKGFLGFSGLGLGDGCFASVDIITDNK
jgi:hypothetical protein